MEAVRSGGNTKNIKAITRHKYTFGKKHLNSISETRIFPKMSSWLCANHKTGGDRWSNQELLSNMLF